jgi:hypothetical protein
VRAVEYVLGLVAAVLGLVAAMLFAVISELVRAEIRGRLDRIPLALLAMAARRLPREQYEAHYVEEWLPELDHVLQGYQATPITRLILGIRFAAGLWLSAPRIGRELAGAVQNAEPLAYQATLHQTIRGELLRSKSEVVIANCLHSIGLQYEYERWLEGTVDQGHRLLPDFTIIGRTGKVVLWEHLGMHDDPVYAEHWHRKLAWYTRNGFELDKNLFVTSQTGSLDTRAAEATARKVQKALG